MPSLAAGLKMLLDINQLKKTVKDGVTKGIWVYYPSEEGIGYGTVSPVPLVEISENVTLYTPEEAQRVGVKIKGETVVEEKCPVCSQFPCVCDDDDDGKRLTRSRWTEPLPKPSRRSLTSATTRRSRA